MAIDAYSTCPAGTGKKIKFCCSDLVAELEKIDRMLEGEQYIATLQHIDQLEAKGLHRACLMAIKAELLRVTSQFDAARPYVDDFVKRFPDHAVAWSEMALMAAIHDGGQEAVKYLQRSLSLCEGPISARVYEAIAVVANELLEDGRAVAGRALLHLMSVLNPKDRNVVERLVYFNRAANVPLLLKNDQGMMPCPPDAPWRAKFEAAMEPMRRARWQETADRLAALAAEVPDSPAIWNNLGHIRSWLADDAGAAEALRRYASFYRPPLAQGPEVRQTDHRSPVSLEDAVEAEATAMLLGPAPLGDHVDVVRWSWPVRDAERLQELLLSDRRILPMPVDLSSWPVGDSPPPRLAATLLDRPTPSGEETITRDNVPSMKGQLFLFGRETDRAARLDVMGLSRLDADRAAAELREIGGDTLEGGPEETVIGKVSSSRELLNRRWAPPRGTTRDQLGELLKEDLRNVLLNEWPDKPLGVLDGRSLRQAAADTAAQIKSLAVILVVEQWFERAPDGFDFNELRQRLGLPLLGPIDPRQVDLDRLPLVRLARVEVEPMNDEQLARVFQRASIFHAWDAARNLALALIARPAFASRPERTDAYRILIESAGSTAEGVKVLDEARRESLAANQSCALWDLMELSLRLGQGDGMEAMRLMQHIESRHLNEPGVAQSLTRLLIDAGLLNPDGTSVAMPAGARAAAEPVAPAAEPSKLWTPGSESAGSGGKLWTPGM